MGALPQTGGKEAVKTASESRVVLLASLLVSEGAEMLLTSGMQNGGLRAR